MTTSTDGLVERLRDITHNGTPRCVIEAADRIEAQAARIAELEGALARATEALSDYRGQQYAPWEPRDPDDTIGNMIDNQAWVMMSHIGSFIGHRDGDPDLMERWQDDWAKNYPDLLKGWFSPHRAAAKYVADQLTIRTALRGGTQP